MEPCPAGAAAEAGPSAGPMAGAIPRPFSIAAMLELAELVALAARETAPEPMEGGPGGLLNISGAGGLEPTA